MTYILHLGHQPTDISGISGLLSTVAAGFDATLDVNAIRFTGVRTYAAPFAVGFAPPVSDLWFGFRYVPPNSDSETIAETTANFLEIGWSAPLSFAEAAVWISRGGAGHLSPATAAGFFELGGATGLTLAQATLYIEVDLP